MMSKKIVKTKPEKGILPHLPDESMVPNRMKINTTGKKESEKYSWSRVLSTYDPKKALPIGCGDIGAAVHGFPDNYTLNIAKNDLWWDDYDADPACYYPGGIRELRERIAAGDIDLKKDIYEASAKRNNHPNQTSAARLTFHFTPGGIYANVKEELNLGNGNVTTSYYVSEGIIEGNFSITSSFSHFDDILYVSATASDSAKHFGKVSFDLTKDPMELDGDLRYPGMPREEIAAVEKEIEEHYTAKPFIDGEFYGFDMRLRTGKVFEESPDLHYTVMMCASDKNFKPSIAGAKLFCEGRPEAKQILFLLTVVSSNDAEDTRDEAKKRLERASGHGMFTVLADGCEFFAHQWNRSWIRLPSERITYPWYWGLYQAMSARKPGKTAPGYLAPWYSSSFASWGYHILTYEQTKSNLGLLTSNHSELLEPWFRLLRDSKEKLQKFTRDYYGMEGTAYPHAISGTGTVIASAITLNGTEMNLQTTGESVKYCWDYYEFTQDKDFLREIGYPFLKEAAVFYDNYLLTADDGEKYIFPSRSQEYVNTVGFADEFMTNSLIDLCMFRNTLDKAAKAADILGIDPELRTKWEEDLAHLRPDYATWPDGTWKVCEDADNLSNNYGVRSVTDLAPVAYTGEIDKWTGSAAMQEAAAKTVKACTKENEIPWDRSFGLIARCRMGDKKYMKGLLDLIPDEYEMGGNLDAPCADGMDYTVNKGAANVSEIFDEMLLQSQNGVIRFFPAYPAEIGDAAFFSLRARGAFLVSSEMRKEKIAYAIIRSLAGNACTIANPYGKNLRIVDFETGKEVTFSGKSGNVTFVTEAEHEYLIEDQTNPYNKIPVIE